MSNPLKRQRTTSDGIANPRDIQSKSTACHSPLISDNVTQAPSSTANSQSQALVTALEDYPYWIRTLPQETVQTLLVRAAQTHPDVGSQVKHHVDRLFQQEQAKVIDFDSISKRVWHTINRHGGSGSQQYEDSFDAYESVVQTIKNIRERCPRYASFGTKRNGLETLRKIGKSICLSDNDVLGHEVRKHFQSNQDITDAMIFILQSMPDDELDKIAESEWWAKLEELIKLADDYCLFAGTLHEVSSLLEGEESSDEEEDASENEEQEENGPA